VLAKGVVGEQDGIAGHVGEHAVRPVQHRRFDEHEFLAVAQVQFVAGLDHMEVPVLVVVSFERLDAVGGAVHGQVGAAAHKLGHGAGMVALSVLCYDVVQLVQETFCLEVVDEFLGIGLPDRIDEDCFLFFYYIAVVAGTLVGGILVAMEFQEIPVYLAHPGNRSSKGFLHAELLSATALICFAMAISSSLSMVLLFDVLVYGIVVL